MEQEIEEKVEGYDEEGLDNLGEYPIDSLLIRQESRSVYEIIRRISKGFYIMDPDFQRDFIWPAAKQSKLIESCLLRIPLPVFYLAERKDGKTIVVDGLQRLSTFQRFLDGELVLSHLNKNNKLNGKRFDDLTPQQQNRIEDTQLILYLIDQKVPEGAKLDIFERVNSGMELTRQQMRNALHDGPGTRWLRDQADSDLFLKATGKSLSRNKMRDREAINRYCAFKILGYENYDGHLDDYLARTLKNMNSLTDIEREQMTARFQQSMANNYLVFGKQAFRKHSPDQTSRNVINIALFDVFSVFLADYSEFMIVEKKDALQQVFFTLLEDEDFKSSISLGTNQRKKVQTRFTIAGKAISEAMR